MTSLPPKPRRKLSKPLVAGAAVVALLIAGGVAWTLRPKAPKDPYRTAEVTRGDITKSVSASGSLQALVTVQVGSQVSGQIKEVRVDFNDHVTKGQVMAVLDPQTYVSRLNQGQAEIGANQASVQQAQAQAEVARANYNRTLTLFNKGISAKAALDTDQAAWKAAQANVAAAKARVAQSRASLAATQVDLGRTTIVAPIDGVVVDRQIEPGQTVAASLQAPVLFQIAQDLSQLQVKINVDEADIGQVQEGQIVKFTVDAFPDDNFEGVVTQVRKQPETSSNVVAYIVMAEADNPGGKLLPGMTANADIVLDRKRDVLKVPSAALRWSPDSQTSSQTQRGGAMGGPPGMGGPPPGGGGARQGGQGGQGGAGMRMLEQLDLDAGQKEKAQAIMTQARQKAQTAGDDPKVRREAMRKAMQEALTQLEPILKPAQKEKLAAVRARMAAMGGARRDGMAQGVVWVLRKNKPTPIAVQTGATDGSFTQIVGPLKPGDQVITGGGPKAKVQARSPLGGAPGGGVRVRM